MSGMKKQEQASEAIAAQSRMEKHKGTMEKAPREKVAKISPKRLSWPCAHAISLLMEKRYLL